MGGHFKQRAAITNLANDLVVKGQEFRSYNFHLEAIRMLREIAYEQERRQNSTSKRTGGNCKQRIVTIDRISSRLDKEVGGLFCEEQTAEFYKSLFAGCIGFKSSICIKHKNFFNPYAL